MAYLVKQGEDITNGYKEYFIDTKEELKDIRVEYCAPGSIAYVITTGDVYMLTSKKEWVLQ